MKQIYAVQIAHKRSHWDVLDTPSAQLVCVVVIITCNILTVTGDFDEMLSQDVCKVEYRLLYPFLRTTT